MADENEGEEEEEGGGGKKKIIMIVGALAAAGGVYNFVLKAPPPTEEELAEAEAMAAAAEPVEGEIVQMEEMILNIEADETGNGGFLRIGLALVLEEGVLVADFEMQQAIALDVSVQYLSSINAETLRTAEGRQAAKDELAVLIREAYGDEMVVRVLFTSLVMQ
ncbi:MAG: flagellar basal body-associated FliL family protein [Actinomycetota bacterium]